MLHSSVCAILVFYEASGVSLFFHYLQRYCQFESGLPRKSPNPLVNQEQTKGGEMYLPRPRDRLVR